VKPKPEPWQSYPSYQPVPVARERVWRERFPITPVDHEVEVGPVLPKEHAALELFLAMATEERDGRRRQADGPARPIRLRRQEHNLVTDALQRRNDADRASVEVDGSPLSAKSSPPFIGLLAISGAVDHRADEGVGSNELVRSPYCLARTTA
jgi:hypothetical protein